MSETVEQIIARQEGYGPYTLFGVPDSMSQSERAAYLMAVDIFEHALTDFPDDVVIAKSVLGRITVAMRRMVRSGVGVSH